MALLDHALPAQIKAHFLCPPWASPLQPSTIVNSLFPETVAKQLYQEREDQKKNQDKPVDSFLGDQHTNNGLESEGASLSRQSHCESLQRNDYIVCRSQRVYSLVFQSHSWRCVCLTRNLVSQIWRDCPRTWSVQGRRRFPRDVLSFLQFLDPCKDHATS